MPPVRRLVVALFVTESLLLGFALASPSPPVGPHVHQDHDHGEAGELPPAAEIARIQALVTADGARADDTGRTGAGGRAVAYHPGGRAIRSGPIAARAPEARLFRTGYMGLEPTLGVNRDGWVFIQAAAQNALLFESRVLRSDDQGRSWVDISPRLVAGVYQRLYTEDPYLFLDQTTGRLFTDDLILPCQLLSGTDNGGVSWTTDLVACEITDHQTIFAGPAPAGGDKPRATPTSSTTAPSGSAPPARHPSARPA